MNAFLHGFFFVHFVLTLILVWTVCPPTTTNPCPSRTSEWELIWKWDLCGIINYIEIRSQHIRMDPNPLTYKCPCKKWKQRQTHSGRTPCDDGGGDGLMSVLAKGAKGCGPPPAAARQESSHRERGRPCRTWVQPTSLQSCERANFCWFKPPSLWQLTMVAPRN